MPALLFVLLLVSASACGQAGRSPASAAKTKVPGDTLYRYGTGTADGIGKYYLGREIAHVMGHEGADWLERNERTREERTDLLIDLLGLRPTDAVADLGAGTGYFSFRMADRLPRGTVLAVDIQPEMIALLRQRQASQPTTGKAGKVVPVLGTVQDPRLPADSLDLVLVVDAYHEFDHPYEMMRAVARALRPGGRLALVEYRAEDPNVPIKEVHKMSEAQAKREMAAVGLAWQRTDRRLPWQHVLFFSRKD